MCWWRKGKSFTGSKQEVRAQGEGGVVCLSCSHRVPSAQLRARLTKATH